MLSELSESSPSPYSILIVAAADQAIAEVVGKDPQLRNAVRSVLITGSSLADLISPMRLEFPEPVPSQTMKLHGAVYCWLFAFLAKNEGMSSLRFLDSGLSGTAELLFIVDDPDVIELQSLKERVIEKLHAIINFAPPIACVVTTIDSFDAASLRSGRVLYDRLKGKSKAELTSENTISEESIEAVMSTISSAANQVENTHVRNDANQNGGADWGSLALKNFTAVRDDPNAMVLLDLVSQIVKNQSDWHRSNAEFFGHLQRNEFDELLMTDATNEFGELKGYDKNSEYTICHVEGIRNGAKVVKANEVMFKLRGLEHYRGDINNWIDLIKEYVSRAYIHELVRPDCGYLAETGPMTFSLEKANLPMPQSQLKKCIGFFMRRIGMGRDTDLITLRVHNISDFWRFKLANQQIHEKAARKGVELDRHQLNQKLTKLVAWVWSHGLSIDYCDLMIAVKGSGQIDELWILDLERLSFGELVDEQHLLLDTLYDLKTRLSKDNWYYVLDNAYHTSSKVNGIPSLSEICPYLNPLSQRRRLGLRGLRILHRLTSLVGERMHDLAWTKLVALGVKQGL
jgi:hypothetical protein